MKSFINNITKTRKGYAIFSSVVNYSSSNLIAENLMYGISIVDEEGNEIDYASTNSNSAPNVYITVYSR